ncbi:MAG: exodeoxyribonuclease VII small subunit [Alphaproteobacteria bacterium]|jgi:exodeoxyribonuclease VII small subunit|nr:exodeoxyribonuclease VII small subunit [Alphaproteobacteria bacterium]
MSPTPLEALSFEAALEELERIVQALERGSVPLDEQVRMYERGAQIKAHCEQKLAEAQLKVDQIVLGEGGQVSTQPAKLG